MSVAVRLKAWRRFFTGRKLIILSAFGIAFFALSVPLDFSAPIGQRNVSLVDKLLMIFGPAFSAKMEIKDPAATITLKFYSVYDVAFTDSRYVTVSTSRGKITRPMCGHHDWGYWSRTSIYLTEDRNIAVLGSGYCDYLFSLDPLGMTDAVVLPSAGWTYFGAFGLAQHPGPGPAKFELRFAPASEQGECIEQLSSEPARELSPRREARTERCPPLQWLEPGG